MKKHFYLICMIFACFGTALGNDTKPYSSETYSEKENRILLRKVESDTCTASSFKDKFMTEITDPNCTSIGCFTSIVPTAQTDHLIIPAGHRFQLLFKQGEQYTDGSGAVPGNHDFTAYIPINGSSELGYLSVNHENTPGGVSILDLHLDTSTNLWTVDSSQPVDLYNNALVTTTRNCSGGITPWGTVVTAEESTNAGDNNNDGYQDVGWLVEIDPATAEVMNYGNGQEKLWAMGRMAHENVVISADSTTAYYGEDGNTSCVYKYVMDTPGDLSSGTVYVLKLDAPMENGDPTTPTGEWIQVPNSTIAECNNISATAGALGGTNFNNVEDCEISAINGKIYFTSKSEGQIYRFTDNGNTVSNFETYAGGMDYTIETTQGNYTVSWGSGNDNLTFDGEGNLWVLQDGGNNYIWVIRPDHTQSNPHVDLFASMPAGSEPTGLTFTPDYKYGFFSIQHPSSSNAPQLDAIGNMVTIDQSATVVFSLDQHLAIHTPTELSKTVNLYPNPTKGQLTVQVDDTAGKEIAIEIFDLLGRKVATIEGKETTGNPQEISINLAKFTSGEQLLIVQVKIGDQMKQFKVLKTN